ncbi:MAG TPA: PQQ-binding-like beta-propeller repeat protein [Ginsengibacter sp.]
MRATLTGKLIAFCGLIIFLSLSSCTKPNTDTPTPPLSSEKNITSFSFKVANNPTLTADVIGNINSDSIFIIVPFGTVITNLIPSITISGISISPSDLTQQNFTNPVSYLVTAKDASTKSYTVVVNIGAIEATLFINSTYPGSNGGGYGRIFALDANTGLLKWKYTATVSALESSNAFDKGFIYTGIGNNISSIDTASKKITWNFTTGGFVESTPTIANGILYINSNDGYLYAVDAATGSLKWNYFEGAAPGPTAANFSSPTVVDGVVYVGCFDGYLYAINALTGILKWKIFDTYNIGGWFESSPSVVNGVVYITDIYYDLIALNANDGSLKWDFKNIETTVSSPTVVGNIIYVGSSTGLYAIDANTGAFIWEYPTPYPINGSPIVSNGTIFVGITSPDNSAFYAINATSGALKWVFTDVSNFYVSDFYSSPIVFNDVVFVGSYASIFAINANTGILKWKYEIDNKLDEVRTSPCIVDEKGNIYYSGISGSQN